jgi:8-oxo-dGTP pyrophosphatase MutT (NUDIX family)
LKELRKKIGHDMVLMPSAVVLIWDDDGRLLLVKDKDIGLWQTVGGGLDPDEAPEDAAKREALEEVNVEVELTGLRGVVGGKGFRIIYPNKDEVAYVAIVYDARIKSGEVKPDNEEASDAKWYAKSELAGLELDDYTRKLFRKLGIA